MVSKLIHAERFQTQGEVLSALIAHGIASNQSVVSRVLRRIGATKRRGKDGSSYYMIEEKPMTPSFALHALVKSISASDTLVLIQTRSGSASTIAQLIEDRGNHLLLGTVGGDSTVLLVPSKGVSPDALREWAESLLFETNEKKVGNEREKHAAK